MYRTFNMGARHDPRRLAEPPARRRALARASRRDVLRHRARSWPAQVSAFEGEARRPKASASSSAAAAPTSRPSSTPRGGATSAARSRSSSRTSRAAARPRACPPRRDRHARLPDHRGRAREEFDAELAGAPRAPPCRPRLPRRLHAPPLAGLRPGLRRADPERPPVAAAGVPRARAQTAGPRARRRR